MTDRAMLARPPVRRSADVRRPAVDAAEVEPAEPTTAGSVTAERPGSAPMPLTGLARPVAPVVGRADDPAERAADATATAVVGALRRQHQPVDHDRPAHPEQCRHPGPVAMPAGPTIRRMTVDGTRIRPYGKTGKELWEYVRQNLYSVYGTKSVYLEEFCDSDVDYGSPQEFLVAFKKRLAELGKLRTLKLGRPAWPEHYKSKLGVATGDNIRHVVRNATLKRALLDDYDQTKLLYEDHFAQEASDSTDMDVEADGAQVEEALVRRYGQMAAALGVKSDSNSSERIVHDIYDALYLNAANLFAGVGGDNQLIGFLADPMEEYGRHLESLGATPMSITQVYDTIWQLAVTSYNKVKGAAAKGKTLGKLDELMQTIKNLVVSRRAEWIKEVTGGKLDKDAEAPANLLAEDPIDFGANFGFDLLDVRSGQKGEEDAAERNRTLIEVETALSGEILPDTDDLQDILVKFMSLSG